MNSPEEGCGAKAGFRNCGRRTSGANSQHNDVTARRDGNNKEIDMKLLKCEITIRTADAKSKTVYGLFRSSFDAYISASNSVNQLCYVKVRVLR